MKRILFLAIAVLGSSFFVGCSNNAAEDEGPKAGTVTNKDGKPLSAEEVKNLPKAEGAFDGVPGGPGALKKKGGPR